MGSHDRPTNIMHKSLLLECASEDRMGELQGRTQAHGQDHEECKPNDYVPERGITTNYDLILYN